LEKLHEGGFLISKIKQIMERIFDKKLKNYGIDLNAAQGRIIFSLWQSDNIPIRELARRTALSKTTLTSMLERLEQSGYIVMKADTADKRKTLVVLSEKIKAVEARHEAVSKEMNALFYRGITEKEIEAFEKTLKKILANLVMFEEGRKHENE
jgi:MarR family transcriptional regulator, organic hydroperoxide resistance regulator